jgi:hypothetical protein
MGANVYDNFFDIEEKPSDWSQWETHLGSSNRLDQLRGLAAFWSHDNLKSMGELNENTTRRLEELANSEVPWLSEEATAALKLIATGVSRPNHQFPRRCASHFSQYVHPQRAYQFTSSSKLLDDSDWAVESMPSMIYWSQLHYDRNATTD